MVVVWGGLLSVAKNARVLDHVFFVIAHPHLLVYVLDVDLRVWILVSIVFLPGVVILTHQTVLLLVIILAGLPGLVHELVYP